MTERFTLLEEPRLAFAHGQCADDPHDGLALFGALGSASSAASMPAHVVIGRRRGIDLWQSWCGVFNRPSACVDVARHRPWPPYPGFDVAFGATWPSPEKAYVIDDAAVEVATKRANRHERSFETANLFLGHIPAIKKLDASPALAVCVVPDEVYENCRPNSYVVNPLDDGPSRRAIKRAVENAKSGQLSLYDVLDDWEESVPDPEKYRMSPDFRRQLKARVMAHDLPVQIVRESTLEITDQIRRGEKGTNPLSDRLWNLGTGVYYKCGRKPWKLADVRDGVCYVGIAYRMVEGRGNSACCAAQLFLDSGDGIVFLGEFGPWYSPEKKEFHLSRKSAESLLRGTLETYEKLDGRPLREVFLHARSGIGADEFEGFRRACPSGCKLVGVRVRQDRIGPRLFRHGNRPVLRGTFWQRTERYGFLFTTGFKPRLGTYDGFEVPVPLELTVQHGDAEIVSVARDIMGLTKLNYNACQLGEALPITVKYSNAIGEILLANPALRDVDRRHNFKYYI